MVQDIYDPLDEYVNVYRNRFKEVAEATFIELAREAQVDVQANQETCRKIYNIENGLQNVLEHLSRWRILKVLLWIAVVGAVLTLFFFGNKIEVSMLIVITLFPLIAIAFQFAVVHPKMQELKSESKHVKGAIEKLKQEAWQQMSSLNRLYDWDVLTRMMSKTVPRLEFDPYFTTQRLADLKAVYGWDDSFNAKRSVIYSHSGLINGNPFVICRTREMEMGLKTYYGTKNITWTTRERDSDGKYHTVYHSEQLTASVTANYPEYFEHTRLIYGNTAAPDLIFFRKQNDLAGKEDSLSFKWKKYQLKKKARDLSNHDFAMMTNEEFEVTFNTSNRNDNQQFALLFTPLAQENMLKLLKDDKVGYGDDFDFSKTRKINTIISDHMQELDLDMNPNQYRHFDFNKAKQEFFDINSRYFRAIYFALAPLLCVPMYQQIRPQHDIYGRDMKRHSAFWEHEALANFWGQANFRHPSCVTDCILKTQEVTDSDDRSVIMVYAYGYRIEERLTYIRKWGGDGRMHSVPVYWDEYLPVKGVGNIYMKEDNRFKETDTTTHRQRMEHIERVLGETGFDSYRRHIASKLY